MFPSLERWTVEMKMENDDGRAREEYGDCDHGIRCASSPLSHHNAQVARASRLTFLTLACSFSDSFSAFLACLSSCLEVNCEPEEKDAQKMNK